MTDLVTHLQNFGPVLNAASTLVFDTATVHISDEMKSQTDADEKSLRERFSSNPLVKVSPVKNNPSSSIPILARRKITLNAHLPSHAAASQQKSLNEILCANPPNKVSVTPEAPPPSLGAVSFDEVMEIVDFYEAKLAYYESILQENKLL